MWLQEHFGAKEQMENDPRRVSRPRPPGSGSLRLSDLPNPALRTWLSSVEELARRGVSHSSRAVAAGEQIVVDGQVRQASMRHFEIGGPAPSIVEIRRIVQRAAGMFGGGAVSLSEYRSSPGMVGEGWTIVVGEGSGKRDLGSTEKGRPISKKEAVGWLG